MLALLFVACRSDGGFEKHNAAPEVNILSHSDGDEIQEGYLIELRASVSDPDDDTSSLNASWFAGEREICPLLPPNSDGDSICTATIGLDEAQVRVEVRDPNNSTNSDEVVLDVVISYLI